MEDQNEIYSRLGAIESKVDILLSRDGAIDERVRTLERFSAKSAGIATVVATVVSAFVAYIARHI